MLPANIWICRTHASKDYEPELPQLPASVTQAITASGNTTLDRNLMTLQTMCIPCDGKSSAVVP